MPLLPQDLHLRLAEPGKTEHPDLRGNMIPRAGRALLLQPLPQPSPHLLDTPTHRPQILFPLLEQGRIIQDPACDARTVRRRVGDLRPLQDRQLTRDIGIGPGGVGARCRNEMEGAGALTVQTEVLGEGLRDAQLEPLLDEILDRPRVANEIARREALVRGVEEGEVVALLHDGGDLFPLVLGGIDAGGVVGAGVQEDHGAGGRCLQRGEHAVEVEALCLLVEVGVGGELEADVGEDLVVVRPCWVGEVDGGLLRVEFGEEEAAEVDGAGA